MQVYAIITDGSRFLIPKKAESNNLWQGKIYDKSSIPNQAGQFALFGGKHEKSDQSLEETAKRELLEEAGINIDAYPSTRYKIIDNNHNGYIYFYYKLSPDEFDQASIRIAENIQSRRVHDGEMQSVTVVSKEDLPNYLGKFQAPDNNPSLEAELRSRGRHAIDWYANIAEQASRVNLEELIPERERDRKIRYKKSESFSTMSTASLTSEDTASSPDTPHKTNMSSADEFIRRGSDSSLSSLSSTSGDPSKNMKPWRLSQDFSSTDTTTSASESESSMDRKIWKRNPTSRPPAPPTSTSESKTPEGTNLWERNQGFTTSESESEKPMPKKTWGRGQAPSPQATTALASEKKTSMEREWKRGQTADSTKREPTSSTSFTTPRSTSSRGTTSIADVNIPKDVMNGLGQMRVFDTPTSVSSTPKSAQIKHKPRSYY